MTLCLMPRTEARELKWRYIEASRNAGAPRWPRSWLRRAFDLADIVPSQPRRLLAKNVVLSPAEVADMPPARMSAAHDSLVSKAVSPMRMGKSAILFCLSSR